MADRTSPNKLEARREATHRQLLALGLERFPKQGFATTSIDDLLRGSGQSKGGFYYHFGSKEEFYVAVLAYRNELEREWWRAFDGDFASLKELITVAVAGLDPVTNVPDAIIHGQFRDAAADHPELLAEGNRLFTARRQTLTHFFGLFDDRGWFRTDIPADELNRRVFAVIDGFYLSHHLLGTPTDGLADALVRLLRP